jgi:molybdate transport system regulatory protein
MVGHIEAAMELKAKVWIERRGRFVLGDGGVALLEMIDGTGSIQAAARRLGWSYRHTWGYLRNLEEASGRKFVSRQHGGAAGGGAELTSAGREFVRRYRSFRADLERVIRARARRLAL